MSSLLDLAVFPGNQGGPLMHIPAKAVAFGEALQDEFFYALQLQKKAKAMAEAFVKEGTISFQEVNNHMMLIDLKQRNFWKRS
jgi:glycine hydroxymethyltransferase